MYGVFRSLILAAAVLVGSTGGVLAQSIGPDEAVGLHGVAAQHLALSPTQRSAIYRAVVQQRVRPLASGVPAAVGASVPSSIVLRDLPEQVQIEGTEPGLLKYAEVEEGVVMIDPVGMRVIDVIRRTEP